MSRHALAVGLALAVCLGYSSATRASATTESALVDRVVESTGGPARAALQAAMQAYQRAEQAGLIANPGLLTLIDYTRPSLDRRPAGLVIQTAVLIDNRCYGTVTEQLTPS